MFSQFFVVTSDTCTQYCIFGLLHKAYPYLTTKGTDKINNHQSNLFQIQLFGVNPGQCLFHNISMMAELTVEMLRKETLVGTQELYLEQV